jgi:hypothetical protein
MLPPEALALEVPLDVALELALADDVALDELDELPQALITIAAMNVSSNAANGLVCLFTDPPQNRFESQSDNLFPTGPGSEPDWPRSLTLIKPKHDLKHRSLPGVSAAERFR